MTNEFVSEETTPQEKDLRMYGEFVRARHTNGVANHKNGHVTGSDYFIHTGKECEMLKLLEVVEE